MSRVAQWIAAHEGDHGTTYDRLRDGEEHPADGTVHAWRLPMMNGKASHSHAKQPKHVENSTDATRGEPLAMRAQKRKLELETALEILPAEEQRARNDIEVALASINAPLTGDVDHLADTTTSDLSRLLENSKHLAEVVHASKSRTRT